ncbi:MAG: hypothetical protein ACSHYA_18460 [Opitutaceae bacterium]
MRQIIYSLIFLYAQGVLTASNLYLSIVDDLHQISQIKEAVVEPSPFLRDPFDGEVGNAKVISDLDASFKKYETLMARVSDVLSQELLQKYLEEQNNITKKLLVRICWDLKGRREEYKGLLDFYNNPDLARGSPNRHDILMSEEAQRYKSKDYLFTWAYYLYAPEVETIHILDGYGMFQNTHGRIIGTLSQIDEGVFLPFVMRQLNFDISLAEDGEDNLGFFERRIRNGIYFYLVKYPNSESMDVLLRVIKQVEQPKSFGNFFRRTVDRHGEDYLDAWTILFNSSTGNPKLKAFLSGFTNEPDVP